MKMNWKKIAVALCVCAALMSSAFAEEKRLGDLIYVPAMRAQTSAGTIAVRVEGLTLDPDQEDPVLVDSLAFIVNVPSRTVVTAIDQTETNNNIFTNIDGAVIV